MSGLHRIVHSRYKERKKEEKKKRLDKNLYWRCTNESFRRRQNTLLTFCSVLVVMAKDG